MRSIAWMSEKGGTGKSTSAVNVAVGMAKRGLRVLLVDADPQSNTSWVMTQGWGAEAPTLTEVLLEGTDPADAVRPTGAPGLDLLPATGRLADVNFALAGEMGRERRLRRALAELGGYDVVMIDTGPSRSLINVNVLNAVGEVFCPVDGGVFSITGLVSIQGVIAEVRQFLDNGDLRLGGLLLTHAKRDNLCKDVEGQVRAAFGSLVFRTSIPSNTKVGEAHARCLSVLDYAPKSPGAVAYAALVREVMGDGEEQRAGRAVDGAVDAERAAGAAGRDRCRAAG